MSTDDGYPTRADQACLWCRLRKKRCDKVLPTCGYCERKGLECGHQASAPPSSPSVRDGSASVGASSSMLDRGLSSSATSAGTFLTAVTPISPEGVVVPTLPTEMVALGVITTQSNVYHQVLRIIRGTGQFVDDVTARYFQSIHRCLPVISRTRFHRSLVTFGSVPAADFSALLLAICLVTFEAPPELEHPSGGGGSSSRPAVNRQALHLATRSVLAQVQALTSTTPSVRLIQAWLLLALYEYAHGQPDDAFQTVAVCARMAYRARIHTRPAQRRAVDPAVLLETEEAASTWWGIVICERNIFCDVSTREQPLVSRAPGKDARLPPEPELFGQSDFPSPGSVPDIPVSCLTSANVGGFGRLAQAACLLDQVLHAIDPAVSASPGHDVDALLVRLDGLDSSLQTLLTTVMQVSRPFEMVVFCGAIACAIRALYLLHAHILALPASLSVGVSAKFRPLAEWFRLSHAALGTLAGMVLEIAETRERLTRQVLEAEPPSFAYCIRATLAYLRDAPPAWREDGTGRLSDAEQRLGRAWCWYEERWDFCTS